MFKKLLFFTTTLFLLNIFAITAQEKAPKENPLIPQARVNHRSLGDKSFAISAGLYIPLFTILSADWAGTDYTAGTHPTNLNLGGAGSLSFSFYLSKNWKLGAQIAGSFAPDINNNYAYTIPITIKGAYEFHPSGRFSIPVFLGLGIAMTSWKTDNFHVDMIIQPGFGFYFDWSYEWSFGLNVSYLFIPQQGYENAYENSIGNFMDITFTVEYHL